MFKTLLLKEFRNYLLTFKFSAALLTSTLLIVISVWVLGDDYVRRLNTYTAMADNAAVEAANQYVPSRVQPNIHRPPSPLGIFAQGEEKRLGNSVEIHRWSVPVEASDSLTDNMLLVAQPPFDLLMIFNLVISLFGLLLTYDVISGEKEAGTLKLVVISGPGRPVIFLTKFIASILVLSIPVVLGIIMSLLVLSLIHGVTFQATHMIAMGMMILSGLMFGAVFAGIGMLCSTLATKSSTALVMALFVWTVTVLLLPASANSIATALHPLRSPRELADFEQRTLNELNEERVALRREKWPNSGSGWGCWNPNGETAYIFDTWPDAYRDQMGYYRYLEEKRQARAAKVFNLKKEHQAEKKKQLALTRLIQSISPSFYLRRAFTSLAATDYETHDEFMSRSRKYRSEFLNSYKNKGLFSNNILGLFSRRTVEEALSEESWNQRRQFYRERIERGDDIWAVVGEENFERLPSDFVPAFSNGIGKSDFEAGITNLSILIFIVLLLFAAGFVLFIRYDVR